MASEAETTAMRRALVLAAADGIPTGPNPRVGAVLLDAAGVELATGVHRGAGTLHAEVDALTALARAGGSAVGATAVVTLEPCNHTGRTGPCARALVDAGVSRVVYAQSDPNPVAAGGGAALAAAGVAVEGDLLADEAAALNPIWTFAVTAGRPYVTWKYAASLDGRSAAADGSSRWITGEASRADVHQLRAQVDAVVTGTGSVLADDPQLTVRAGGSAGEALAYARQPLRVVLGHRSVPTDARVLDGSAPTLLLATHDVAAALSELYARDVQHVLLEGGPTLAGAFVRAGLVDRVVGYVAPVLLGAGTPALGDVGITTIGAALRLETLDVTRFGPDVRITARVVRRQES